MSDTVIKVQNLSKRYRIGLKEERHDTFTAQMMAMLKAPLRNFQKLKSLSRFKGEDKSVFWALKDVNFEVKQGEVLGIIGHNGAGKSTLLKILSHITEPTSGEVLIKGRVSALLEVGTGFHPELTGRENIFMNGTILGMTKKEIDHKFDEIVDFSGVEKYIDTPVKFFSSGMKVRLGFAVAAHLEPEILIIDEVLAVGDAEFQRKCLGKMEDVSKNGRTVLFVSHDLGAVRNLCQRVITLINGGIIFNGNTHKGIDFYLKKNIKSQSLRSSQDGQANKFMISEVSMFNESGLHSDTFQSGGSLLVVIKFFSTLSKNELKHLVFHLFFSTLSGTRLFVCSNKFVRDAKIDLDKMQITCMLPRIPLIPSVYNIDIVCKNNNEILDSLFNIYSIKVIEGVYPKYHSLPPLSSGPILIEQIWNS